MLTESDGTELFGVVPSGVRGRDSALAMRLGFAMHRGFERISTWSADQSQRHVAVSVAAGAIGVNGLNSKVWSMETFGIWQWSISKVYYCT